MLQDPAARRYIDTNNADVLNIYRLPARLSIEQVARLLNFQVYELVLLVHLGRLKCLGAPRPNARKWFGRVYVEKLADDQEWLSQSTKAVARAVREKNGLPAPRPQGQILPT